MEDPGGAHEDAADTPDPALEPGIEDPGESEVHPGRS